MCYESNVLGSPDDARIPQVCQTERVIVQTRGLHERDVPAKTIDPSIEALIDGRGDVLQRRMRLPINLWHIPWICRILLTAN